MNGLAGIVSFHGPNRPGLVSKMVRLLAHRSPNKTGHVSDINDRVSLGQIGPQPLVQSDRWTLVYNGAVYNRPELNARFNLDPGLSEGELLLDIFRQKGPDGLAGVNGDLALAIHDRRAEELLLWRDRFGVMPLYYAQLKEETVFASEIKALLLHPDISPEPNQAMLYDFLATHYRYIHRDPARTYYKGIHQVPPAHYLVIAPDRVTLRQYWQLELDPDVSGLSSAEADADLLDILRDSVARRLSTNGKMGFSVSSGMDSSSVCSLASVITGEKQDIYSVGYDGGEYDETDGITPLADQYAAKRRHLILAEPDILDEISQLVEFHDGPVCTVTWLSHCHMARAAAGDGKDILFSGLGGDEALAGEYEHFLYYFADLKYSGQERRLHSEIDSWIRLHDHPVFKKSPAVVNDAFDRLIDFNHPGRILPDIRRYIANHRFFSADFLSLDRGDLTMPHPFSGYLANRCFQDLTLETTPPSLCADQANVSRFGLFTRFPFLDHRVIRFCFSLPGTLKYDQGITKAILRRAMKGILPEANRNNTVKTGFNAPLGKWIMGNRKDDIRELLFSRSLRDRGWLKDGAASRLWAEHEQGRANHMMLIWQLINAELWFKSLSRIGQAGKGI